MDESGFKGFQSGVWYGVVAPARTPPEILDKLAAEVRKAMQKPEVLQRLTTLGVEPAAGTPEEFRRFFLAELKAYGEMARVAGVRPE